MIVRMWRGPVPKAKRTAYVEYPKKTGLKDYQTIAGDRGVCLLTRDIGDQVEFLTVFNPLVEHFEIEATPEDPAKLK